MIEASIISNLAAAEGLEYIGASGVALGEEDKLRLQNWQEQGFAGDMNYMKRKAELFCDARFLLESAKTILLFAAPYSKEKFNPETTTPNKNNDNNQQPETSRGKTQARVARYAWGKDYHKVLRKKLSKILLETQRITKIDFNFRVFSDSAPLLERAYGRKLGYGFIGKNSMLIRPSVGSFFFLAEAVTDYPFEQNRETPHFADCGECTLCVSACPTSAIANNRTIDARRCISYLTIEKRGLFTEQESKSIREWIFGCDICQEVCPFNHAPLKLEQKSIKEFSAATGVGMFLNLKDVLQIKTDEEFYRRFAGTPLTRAKREGLLRNAAAVAANIGAIECLEDLKKIAQKDQSHIVRQAAAAAVKALESELL
ncbi:MAG TPA: tRNA epoxyqueuosine(34) reductase QueG [Oligoflexia bacterium]|nr:tRNA epoxyqueuosine(34) reductase QueG [Oligoflexia bacterium]HMP27767.1 tRNA epoxyqueuosine(34) reductase QueG [Oligoflexia bacterium]